MSIRKNFGNIVLALALVLVASVPVMAKNSHKFSLAYEVVLNGSHLAPGQYNVRWENHSPQLTVTFLQGKHIQATAEGKMVDRGEKHASDSIVYDQNPDGSQTLREIRFGGSTRAIVFSE